MSLRLLISGALAFDSIMTFAGRFQDHLHLNPMQDLAVSFEAAQFRREWGGCAGNIAYSFQQLGGQSILLGCVGQDGQAYIDRLARLGCVTQYIELIPEAYTAQAFITTDSSHHQIMFFHAGALREKPTTAITDNVEHIGLAIVSPEECIVMQQRVREAKSKGIPCLFDPGQALPRFSREVLSDTLSQCTWLIVNEYESASLEKILGQSLPQIASGLEALVVTLGAEGSLIYLSSGELLFIPPVDVDKVMDPTGSGDAYRAGLAYGLLQHWSWLKSGRLASLLGAKAVASMGAQNHQIDRSSLAAEYAQLFEEPLWE
jgi:adenosine kinase